MYLFSSFIEEASEYHLNRRSFLKVGALVSLLSLSPDNVLAALPRKGSPERSLSFYNTHTGEKLSTVFKFKGRYMRDALKDINYILRDHRTDEVKAMSRGLLDFLHSINATMETSQPFHIISGYRSPKTNTLLRSRSKGIAKNSMHLYGKAVDVRMPGCSLAQLRRAAQSLKRGGVGYYPKSNFVHVDVGRVRSW